MESQSTALERRGPKDSPEFFNGVMCSHMFAYLKGDRLFVFADAYYPEPDEYWDDEGYESRCCTLEAEATRENWQFLYQVGRALTRGGQVTIHFKDRDPVELACDGRTMTIG